MPRLRPGGAAMLRNNRGTLRSLPFITLLAGLAPVGRQPMDGVRALVEAGLNEAWLVRRAGSTVTVLGPGPMTCG